MQIKLTKDHKKPNGKKIPKGTIISVAEGHPYKDFELVTNNGAKKIKKTTVKND